MTNYGIYYFSGTGNSLWSANRLAELLGDAEVVPISRCMVRDGKPIPRHERFTIDCQNLIIIYPAYAFEAPTMVRRFVKQADIRAQRITALVTYGSIYGGALSEIKRLLARKGLTLNYADGIPSQENYIPIFGAQSSARQSKRLTAQAQATQKAAHHILSQTDNSVRSIRPLSKIVSVLFRTFKPLIACLCRVNKTCNGCGICQRVCPAAAIEMRATNKGVRPHYLKTRCEHCQACFNYCPQKSHTQLRLRAGKYRYHHPEIPLDEISRQTDGTNK